MRNRERERDVFTSESGIFEFCDRGASESLDCDPIGDGDIRESKMA